MRKVIIAGGRDFGFVAPDMSYDELDEVVVQRQNGYDALFNYFADEVPHDGRDLLDAKHSFEIVSGKAKGADTFGEEFARVWSIPVKEFPADWDQYGKAAGHRRNYEMAKYADVLIAFWDGESRGTRDMIDTALREGLEIHVYRY